MFIVLKIELNKKKILLVLVIDYKCQLCIDLRLINSIFSVVKIVGHAKN